ncbi:MAG: pyridoxal phosphate-dependent aminotransferase, partial [bacterium]|nr:pyridoxal phosphate-dependent aminotransferase [bacterium]
NSFSIMAHVTLVPIVTTIKNGFHLPSISEIEKKITSKTKGILICNPGNPTGTVYTRDEMDILVEIAEEHELYLFSDEVYREFTYDGAKAISLFEYAQDYPDGIVVIDSLSKRYSLCGARLGVLVSRNSVFMDTVLKFAQARLSVALIDQLMASKLTEVPEDYFKKVHKEYNERRDILVSHLKKIPGVFCQKPEGAFYLIVKLPVKSAEDFARWLLTDFHDNNETIMIVPAQGFYKTKGLGMDEVRMAYVINQKSLVRCAELLKLALQKYKD